MPYETEYYLSGADGSSDEERMVGAPMEPPWVFRSYKLKSDNVVRLTKTQSAVTHSRSLQYIDKTAAP